MAELAAGGPVEEDLYMPFLDDIYKQWDVWFACFER
jgi:hypothetical protein